MRDDTNNLVVVNNVGSSFTTASPSLTARLQTLRYVARRSRLGHPIHTIQRAFPCSAFRVDDDTLASSRTRRAAQHRGHGFPWLLIMLS
jgi:hypothetical protein